MAEVTETPVSKKNIKKDFIFAVGRRKEAVARVRLYATVKEDLSWGETGVKKGDILVNTKPSGVYFGSTVAHAKLTAPLRVVNGLEKYAFTIRVEGGGKNGQLEAAILGIARALKKLDAEKFQPILRKKGHLTRDARERQRRKVGMGGKSRRKKQSPKR